MLFAVLDLAGWFNIIGISLEIIGFLFLLSDFWNWVNKGKLIELNIPKLWYYWANNKLNKWSIPLVIIGLFFQMLATVIESVLL